MVIDNQSPDPARAQSYSQYSGASPQTKEKKKGCGCFLWGCAAMLVLSFMMAGCSGLIGYLGYQSALEITSTEPVEIKAVILEEEEWEELQGRMREFGVALEENTAAELSITANELNAAIAMEPRLNSEFGKKVYFKILEDNLVEIQTSVPLSAIPGFDGRFFNGTVTVEAQTQGGRPEVFIRNLIVDGDTVAEAFKEGLASTDLIQEFSKNRDFGKYFKQIEKIEVKDGKIRVSTKKQ